MKIILFLTLLLSFSVNASANEETLKLSSGDTLEIFVSGSPELSSQKRVAIDGSINLPLIGRVLVKGLSTNEAEKRIENELKKGNYLRKPQVQLSHVQSVKNVATILGQIPQPGKYPIGESNKNLIDLIAIAGGLTSMHRGVLLRSSNGKRQEYAFNIEELLLSTGASNLGKKEYELQAGDIVFVKKAPVYYTYGEIGIVSAFELQKDLTLMQAISIAGGLSKIADKDDIKIKRKQKDGYKLINASLDEFIREDDIIVVEESLF